MIIHLLDTGGTMKIEHEVINASQYSSENARSIWLGLNGDCCPNLGLYGDFPELNNLNNCCQLANFPGWSMLGSSVRPVDKDSILVILKTESDTTEYTAGRRR